MNPPPLAVHQALSSPGTRTFSYPFSGSRYSIANGLRQNSTGYHLHYALCLKTFLEDYLSDSGLYRHSRQCGHYYSFYPSHGALYLDMESLDLIDIANEDDSLLPTKWASDDKHLLSPQNGLNLTPAPSGADCTPPDLQQCLHTDSMARVEGGVHVPRYMGSDLNPSITVVSSFVAPETVPADEQQPQEHEQPTNVSLKHVGESSRVPEKTTLPHASANKKKGRSARATTNLRKSLAWDKAFLTDEGVLDVDELPLAIKAPRKLPDLQPLDIPEIRGTSSPTSFLGIEKVIGLHARTPVLVDVEKINFTTAEQSTRCQPGVHSSRTHETSYLTNLSAKTPTTTPARPELKVSKSDKTRLVPVSQPIKAEGLKGTRLRLPNTLTGKKEKMELSPNPANEAESNFLRRCQSSSSVLSPSSSGSSLSKKVSSVSKKVRNTLGKVLPGGFSGSTKSSSPSLEGPFQRNRNPVHLGQPLDAIGENSDNLSPPVSMTKSKSSHSILPAGPANTLPNTKKKGVLLEKGITDASTVISGSEIVVSNLKGSSRMKNVGILMSLCSKAAPSTKKVNEKPSYFKKVSPVFSRKKSGTAAAAAPVEDHVAEKVMFEPVLPRSKALASGLRLPSPKIGFFDATKPVTTEQQSLNSSDNLDRRNHGNTAPAKPKSGLPPTNYAEQQPSEGRNISAPNSRPARTDLPSAPHAKSTGKREKGLGPLLSVPDSPQKRPRGSPIRTIEDPTFTTCNARAETNPDEAYNQNRKSNDVMINSERMSSLRHSSEFDTDLPDHHLQHTERSIPVEDRSARSGVPSAHEMKGKAGNEEVEISSSIHGNPLVEDGTKISPPKQESPTLGYIQSVGHLKEDVRGSTLSAVIEELSPGSKGLFGSTIIDSVLCREEAVNVIGALTSGTRHTECRTLSIADEETNSLAKENFAAPDVDMHHQPAHCQLDELSGNELRHGRDDQQRMRGHQESRKRDSEPKRTAHHDLKMGDAGSKADDRDTCSAGEKSVSCGCNIEEIVIHDVAEVMMGLGDDDNMVQRDCKSVSSTERASNRAIPLRASELRKCSFSSHQVPEEMRLKTSHAEDSPSQGLESSILASPVDSDAHLASAVKKEHVLLINPVSPAVSVTPVTPINPVSKRLSCGTTTVAAESLQDLVNKISTSPSGPAAFHVAQQTAKSPLAVNVGLLNNINSQTTAGNTPRRERHLQVVVDHGAVAESLLYGQENEHIVSDRPRGYGEPQHAANKPATKHRKQFSAQKLEQSDKDMSSMDVSFAFSEERLRALEAAGAETLQMKSGAVQHSPPNKISPNRNPWSPVKKPGKQLGPFDCTKKYGHAAAGQ